MKKRKIILATTNKGKIAELARLLKDSPYEAEGLDQYPELADIEENGATFAENALIKARAAAARTGVLSVADDSGLSVDALGGAPGVFSARYSEDWESLPGESRDQRNTRKLLSALKDVPKERRGCRFVTAIACVHPDGREFVCEGEWRGRILEAPLGENGFGYDPVFFDPALQKTAAQLSREEKNSRSHRGRALRAMLKKLPEFL